jgi:hypothetical protein
MQALICVSLGLPPSAFRRLVQANAATTALHFVPSAGQEAEDSSGTSDADSAETRALLRHMNQSPEVVSNVAAGGPPADGVRIVLVACGGGTGGSSSEDVRATAAAVSAFQVEIQLVCVHETCCWSQRADTCRHTQSLTAAAALMHAGGQAAV